MNRYWMLLCVLAVMGCESHDGGNPLRIPQAEVFEDLLTGEGHLDAGQRMHSWDGPEGAVLAVRIDVPTNPSQEAAFERIRASARLVRWPSMERVATTTLVSAPQPSQPGQYAPAQFVSLMPDEPLGDHWYAVLYDIDEVLDGTGYLSGHGWSPTFGTYGRRFFPHSLTTTRIQAQWTNGVDGRPVFVIAMSIAPSTIGMEPIDRARMMTARFGDGTVCELSPVYTSGTMFAGGVTSSWRCGTPAVDTPLEVSFDLAAAGLSIATISRQPDLALDWEGQVPDPADEGDPNAFRDTDPSDAFFIASEAWYRERSR